MKKFISILLALIMVFSVAACGSNDVSPATDPPKKDNAGTPADSTDENAEDPKVVLRFSSNIPSSEIELNATSTARGINAWIETVEAESNGSIEVQLFADGQLASGTDAILTGIKSGAFEVAHYSSANWASFTDAFAELNIPFLCENYEQAGALLSGELGQGMLDKLSADVDGVQGLALITVGLRHIHNGKNAVSSPADMQGLKVRVSDDPYAIQAIELLGCSGVPMAVGEMYSGLQQKLIDGGDNPMAVLFSNALYEVQKYVTIANFQLTCTCLFMNQDAYDKLADAQKAAVAKANEAATLASAEQAPIAEGELRAKLEELDMEFTDLTEEQFEEFRKVVEPVWEAVRKNIGDERYNRVLDAIA